MRCSLSLCSILRLLWRLSTLFPDAKRRGFVKGPEDDGNPTRCTFEECRLRILWVKANKILPAHSGGDIRSYQILRRLASIHELVFFSYYDGERDTAYEAELARQFPRSVCLCTGKRGLNSVGRGLDYLVRIATPVPYAVSRFESVQVQE